MILLVSENMPTPCILNFKEFLSSTEPFRPNPQLPLVFNNTLLGTKSILFKKKSETTLIF